MQCIVTEKYRNDEAFDCLSMSKAPFSTDSAYGQVMFTMLIRCLMANSANFLILYAGGPSAAPRFMSCRDTDDSE